MEGPIIDAAWDEPAAPPGLRGYDAKEVSRVTATHTGSESLVQQHLKDEVDINTIMRRFGVTDQLPLGPRTGIYGDFTGISDYESAVERVRGAQERFMELPAEIREKFRNDPGELIAAANSMPPEEFEALFAAPEVPPVVE